MTSDDVEWCTPPEIKKAVVRALGGTVDLDPCADPGRTFPAIHHFTEAENGLARWWGHRVYMSPPYGRTIGQWTTKLRDKLAFGWTTGAVVLLPARVDTTWNHELAPLGPGELARIGGSGDRLVGLWLLAGVHGLRESEALGLLWDNLDLAAGTVTARHQLARADGRWLLVEPKTGRSRRSST